MPKRKRDGSVSVRDILERYEHEVFRALKTVKGFERQRLSKRLRDQDITAEKKKRLEREVSVLKSLDLHQTARAHLHLSLLKVKPLSTSPNLPDELRRGVSKPNLPEEEQIALHNVTSGLYNRELVKQAMDRAVKAVCSTLTVTVPENWKRSRKANRESKADEPPDGLGAKSPTSESLKGSAGTNNVVGPDGESEFEGFSDEDDELDTIAAAPENNTERNEETQLEKLNDLVGNSSDEEENWNDDKYAQFRGTETVNVDDMSVSSSDAEPEVDTEFQSPSCFRSPSPPLKKGSKSEMKAPSAARPGQIGGSTFLPSLMGGYVSGSESASDIEEAKPKKRRGQRARQAIWEKKYGSSAKHLHIHKPGIRGGRDSGWDMRRGAVDGDYRSNNLPWKKGIQRPGAGASQQQGEVVPTAKHRKRDDEGKLHPSWEARKKAKETQKKVEFAGQKVVFD